MRNFTAIPERVSVTRTGARDLSALRLDEILERNIRKKLRVYLNITPYHRSPKHFRFIKAATRILRSREQVLHKQYNEVQRRRK